MCAADEKAFYSSAAIKGSSQNGDIETAATLNRCSSLKASPEERPCPQLTGSGAHAGAPAGGRRAPPAHWRRPGLVQNTQQKAKFLFLRVAALSSGERAEGAEAPERCSSA